MAIRLNAPGWNVKRAPERSRTRGRNEPRVERDVLPELLSNARETDEYVLESTPAAGMRGRSEAAGVLDISYDLGPGESAVLVLRHLDSGALTFHSPRAATRSRGRNQVRFVAQVRPAGPPGTRGQRGVASKAVKAIIAKFADAAIDAGVALVLPKLARTFEDTTWRRKKLAEGWLRVTKAGLAAGKLAAGTPRSIDRSLLFIHGTFSNAASAFKPLASSRFFEEVAPLYGDRIFAFDHFTVSRTPEENAEMLLDDLPAGPIPFDVITHSRGGLVLRNLVERASALGRAARRFELGHAVIVAAPNQGTPLATPSRWEDTVGWVANLMEMLPDNPFTTGAEFVADALVWMARQASGNLPGIHAMDGEGELIRELQSPPDPPANKYSVLVSNYNPTGRTLQRLLDMGVDQFFNTANDLVVPSEGGWRIDPTGGRFVPGARIGCFGPGGNIAAGDVTHVGFFSRPETVAFLIPALKGEPQQLLALDPARSLPDRRLLRGGAGVAAPAFTASGRPAAGRRARLTGDNGAAPAPEPSLHITVSNRDLTYEEWPLVVGHYDAARLSGTEAVLDRLLDGEMTRALELGLYPVIPGTQRIFANRHKFASGNFSGVPRPEAVIVAGIGQEGSLQAQHIVVTVRQAVIAWAERQARRNHAPATLQLAATFIGSGGANIAPGQSAQLVARGVVEANDALERASANTANKKGNRLPVVTQLRFVELYLSRATEAWEALKMHAVSAHRFEVDERIVPGTGALPRPLDSSYRGAAYDFISAETRRDAHGNTSIAYALDTTRARTEVRAQSQQARLVQQLVATASNQPGEDPQIGRTLYNLLVPLELEGFLVGAHDTQIGVDDGTAGIPWELLDDGMSDQGGPWAIRSKLLRKYRTERFRPQVKDAGADASILVIGEPRCPPDYGPLPGALDEAKVVHGVLKDRMPGSCVRALFSGGDLEAAPDAREVINALFERSWRIVHIAGHGERVTETGASRGVVLSGDAFLGATEIQTLRVVPELVFVNCCHLGASQEQQLLGGARAPDRPTFAAGVAQALIDVGVRCVVAAGWAVDDAAANVFATTFYGRLLDAARFIDAVADARIAAREFDSHTWAAYQCYGDPDWRLTATPDRSWRPDPQEFAYVASLPAFERVLQTLEVQTTTQGYEPKSQRGRLSVLEDRFTRLELPVTSDIAEGFARAYMAANDLERALQWFDRAVNDTGGRTSFRALEQAANLRCRLAFESVQAKANRETVETARKAIDDQLTRLSKIAAIKDTSERASLMGSAKKRLAMIEALAGNSRAAIEAVRAMRQHYQHAAEISPKDSAFYPILNLIAAELVLRPAARSQNGSAQPLIEQARTGIKAANEARPDFWTRVAEPEVELYDAVDRGELEKKRAAIEELFEDVHRRSKGSSDWRSVLDMARFALQPLAGARGKRSARSKAAAAILARLERYAEGKEQAQATALDLD